ncbi:helix-turn-helix transcriptional regulator [Dictyobacter kobayashii]|uniref:Nitrogen regulation protein B n=1 Tax=Dictyobacter kobayashii TaxID=2014872 RepID=A0A402AI83_9CHLR|nr:hybrid sensor histidine kinase/response regulator transcription factor [Dictyobacter kobayashii]GCE18838.1 hypothetical protein KDK_26380 [Dictyobacter kobayashii]
MEKTDRSINTSPPSSPSTGTLPEVMYSLASLADLYEMGFVLGIDMEPDELRQHILTHMRRTIQAEGACLLLYHAAQQHFIAVAHQGEKLPCGALSSSLNGQEIEQLSLRGPGATLDTIQLNQQTILLITLNCHKTLIGLVALSLSDHNTLLDDRGLLLTYQGNIAGQILYAQQQRTRERHIAIEQERQRIARDLHDSVAQQIAFTLYKLEFIQRLLERQQSQAASVEANRAATLLEESLQELRTSINALRPIQLERHTFFEAVTNLLNQYRNHNPGISMQAELTAIQQIPERLEVPIFRLLQEALANIYKHARATAIWVDMYIQSNLYIISIRDDGIGLPTQHLSTPVPKGSEPASQAGEGKHDITSSHMGLSTMRERVQEVGGRWQLHSQPGTGTTIEASFPLTTPSTELTRREYEILRLLVEGRTNHEIAQKLSIKNETVKAHVHHIMQKLQVKDRAQAILVATTQGWV